MNARPPVPLELVAVVASMPPDEVELLASEELLLDVVELELLELELLLLDDEVCDVVPLVGPFGDVDVVVFVLVGQGVVDLVYVGRVDELDVHVTGGVWVLVPPP